MKEVGNIHHSEIVQSHSL